MTRLFCGPHGHFLPAGISAASPVGSGLISRARLPARLAAHRSDPRSPRALPRVCRSWPTSHTSFCSHLTSCSGGHRRTEAPQRTPGSLKRNAESCRAVRKWPPSLQPEVGPPFSPGDRSSLAASKPVTLTQPPPENQRGLVQR